MPNKATQTRKASSNKNTNIIDMPLLITVLILLALGIVMVLSASAPSALAKYGDSYKFVKTQAVAAVLGIGVMFFFSVFPHQFFKKYYRIIYWISFVLLFSVLVPGLGVEINGAKRWIDISVIRIQPSEITKIGLIIYYAGYYTDSKNKLDTFWGNTLRPIIALGLPIVVLLKIQNHMSAGVVMSLVTMVIILMSGCQLKYYATMFLAMLSVGVISLPFIKDKIIGGFRTNRIIAWLKPFDDPSGTSYQTIQGLYAIGSGGLFGVGLGKSKQKFLYIPEAHNDFIFAIIAEELGFIGCAAILVLFAVFAVRGFLIAIRASDMFGSLVAIGITSLIIVQALLNIAVVTNTIPNTGISLPFLSYGGTSLIILLGSVGVLLNISRSVKKI
ncbi:MAG: putative lipid II flippase FtsW [Clostridia bacterium]|nr:putative lipid II flippase FtsW [Clostridia bacterium]